MSATKEGLIELAVDAETQKIATRKLQHEIAKKLSKKYDKNLSSSNFLKLKDFFYYHENHGDSILDTSGIDYADKISKIFNSLYNLIDLFNKIGYAEFIAPYFEEFERKYNIKISYTKNNDIDQETVDEITKMAEYQSLICEQSDLVRVDYAQDAEDIEFVKKSDFSDIVSIEYMISENKKDKAIKKSKKISDRISLKNQAISGYILDNLDSDIDAND